MTTKIIYDFSTNTTITRDLTSEEQKVFDAEKPNAEKQLANLRLERNILLAETDWMANSDVTMSDAWRTYRQALRDITNTYSSMSDDGFAFPKKPTE